MALVDALPLQLSHGSVDSRESASRKVTPEDCFMSSMTPPWSAIVIERIEGSVMVRKKGLVGWQRTTPSDFGWMCWCHGETRLGFADRAEHHAHASNYRQDLFRTGLIHETARMRLEDRRDPSDLPREFVVRHDRKLRPERSSSWLAVPILIVFVGAALIATGTSIFPTRPPTKPKVAVTEHGPKKSLPIADEERIDRVAPQPRQRLVKCLGARGVTGYTDGTCPAGSQPTPMNDRPTLSIADGMTIQQREAVQEANQVAARQVLEHELRVAQNVDRTSDECRALDAAIATYDAEARQPLPAWRQDRLRILRQEARGRQFALRCQ